MAEKASGIATHVANVAAAAFVLGALIFPGWMALGAAQSYIEDGVWQLSWFAHVTGMTSTVLGFACLALVTPTHLLATWLLKRRAPKLARFAFLLPLALVGLGLSTLIVEALMHALPASQHGKAALQLLAILMICAAPGAFIFYFSVNGRPAGDWRLAALALVWGALFAASYFFGPWRPEPYHPLADRHAVVSKWQSAGSLAMLAVGLCAYAAWRLGWQRLAACLLIAGICTPLIFLVQYASTPMGDGKAHFVVGEQAFAVDWRRAPRRSGEEWSFDVGDLLSSGATKAAANNQKLTVKPAAAPLFQIDEYGQLPAVGRPQWGLHCYDMEYRKREMTFCGDGAMPAEWTTMLIWYGSFGGLVFDDQGARYDLRMPGAAANWRSVRDTVRTSPAAASAPPVGWVEPKNY